MAIRAKQTGGAKLTIDQVLKRIQSLLDKGDRREALKFSEALLKAQTKAQPLHERVVALLLKAGFGSQMRPTLTVALDSHPESKPIRVTAANLMSRIGNYNECAVHLEKLVEIEPSNIRFRTALMRALIDSVQLQRAIDMGRETIELAPEDPQVLAAIGVAFERGGNMDRAEHFLKSALAKDPKIFHARAALSSVIFYKKDVPGSMEEAKRALELLPYRRRTAARREHRCMVLETFSDKFFATRRLRFELQTFNFPGSIRSNRIEFIHSPLVEPSMAATKRDFAEFDIILNNAGIAELNDAVAEANIAHMIAAYPGTRVLNRPEEVAKTSRLAVSEAFGDDAAFINPKYRAYDLASMSPEDAADAVMAEMRFPMFLRPDYTNMGRGMTFAANADELRETLAKLAPDRVYVVEYYECRDDDGIGRCYRAMFLGDGQVFPDRCVSHLGWHSHDKLRRSEKWDELGFGDHEQAYMNAPDETVGFDISKVFGPILDTIKLDIFGIDFGITREGTPILFEANPAMALFGGISREFMRYMAPFHSKQNAATEEYVYKQIKASKGQ